MLGNTFENFKRERAKFARNVEYIKETALDDEIDLCTESGEAVFVKESIDELKEAADMVNKLPNEDIDVSESVEIDKIVNSDGDISFNEMAGI